MEIFNEQETIQLLETLTNTPSPSGYTMKIMKLMAGMLDDIGVSYVQTNKGAIIATVKGKNDARHRLLTAHTDTLGAMVKEVKPSGRLALSRVGGFRWNAVEGEYCTIHTARGEAIRGTILMHETSVHVYSDMGKLPRDEKHIEVRVDAKTTTAEQTRTLGIEVGDFISFDNRFEFTESGFVKSRHLDDKASTTLLIQLLKLIKTENIELPYTTHFYISNNEEIGYGGNASVPEQTVEYIAVDMGAIGDGQQSDEYTVSICAKDSSGPYHYELTRQLVALANANNIDYKLDIYPHYGSDASAAIRAGFDVRHALFGAGIESSHAFERTHVDSLRHTAALLYAYVTSPMIDEED
ncbi:M42 family metallopeptidase [Kurthia huakuii]|uniref:M42 family metallopeptidase n=1 Tax=Kurthia huakuii TaxID=1421019 RepID=UPI000495FC46|nr:M42 family metallopeptidase [Kurthia huakuii]MBM7698499.1 putative aminopeptidase FrvX [Kurthia huakuii]